MTEILDVAGIPGACTLPDADRPVRRAEFDDVFALTTGVDRPTPGHATFRLAGPPDLADQVRDLATREAECCSFFTFTVSSTSSGDVLFEVEVPEAYTAVLDAMVERAGAGR
jgi:hypothetical protein